MRKKLIKPAVSDAASEFSQLFWAARRGHVQLKKKATGDEPGDKSAVEFTKSQGWQWAEGLLEASRLDMLGEHGKALKLLAACEPSVPSQWHGLVHFLRGATLAGTGKYDEAIKAYRKALDDTNFDRPSYAWYNLGNALGAKGEYDEAIKAYRKVIDDTRYDKPARAWNNLGATLRSKGEHDEAIKAFRKAIDDPKYDSPAKAWANLGETYEEIGNREKAQEAFKKALASPDLEGGDHTRARFRLRLLNAKIKPAALSQDDRAMVEKAASSASTDDVEGKIITAIQDAGDTQYEKYLVHPDSKRDDILSILRGWSSAVTLLEGSERRWRGGGYFLKWRGYGVVIDPGFDFLRNFHDAGYHGREISAVVVSHNHPDHNSDLKGIDDLRYEIWKRLAATKKPGGRPYVLVWDQDTDRSTKFNIQKPAHQYEPVVMSSGY
jgi:tetratricopeptide (TPR) repeat protein